MGKLNLSNAFTVVRSALSKHSPEILMGLGITGMLTSTVLAVKATPKAMKLIEEKKKKDNVEKLTPIETVKTAWKCYIPTAATAAVSVSCLIGSCSISLKRNAALATAYKLVESAHKEYREKVIETIGEKKEEEVRDNIAKEKLANNPVQTSKIFITNRGNTLCYDSLSGRYFRTDQHYIRKAENTLNQRMINDCYVSLNDFYDEIGLESVDLGNDLGWNIHTTGLIEVVFSSQLSDNDEPCLVVYFQNAPRYGYSSLA